MPLSHHCRYASKHLKRLPRGFSLIEIMVGMVIGMFGIIVIMQVFAVFEGQKRTTTGGGDAQNAGAIALYGVQRDLQQGGYGISSLPLIGCNVQLRAGPPAVILNTMAPVTINHASIPAGDANTDTLLVVYGNSNGASEGNGITGATGAVYTVQTPTMFSSNDMVIAEPSTRPNPCDLVLDRVVTSAAQVTVQTGVALNILPATPATLYDLGAAPKVQAYAIRGGNLTVCDYMVNNCSLAANTGNTAIWVPIANNIVSMRAQYGQDNNANPMDGIVDVFNQTTPATPCGWMKELAIRIALVARNSQPEKTAVTTAAPVWEGSAANNPAGSAATPIVLTATTVPPGFTWQNFRYKVFQTTVPIRNVVLQGVQTGC